jgi:amino acid transporter
MCEEVQHPSKQVPKAIVGTVILNSLAGFLFLIPLVFVLPDSQELIALVSGQPVPTIMKSAVGNSTGAFLLLLPLIVLLFAVLAARLLSHDLYGHLHEMEEFHTLVSGGK